MTFINILLVFILIALNAFFVSVEFAAVASRRARLDLLSPTTSRAGQLVRRWLENHQERDRLIAASQLGITVVSLALGAVGEKTMTGILGPLFNQVHVPARLSFLTAIIPALPLVFALIVVTAFHVVLGEQVPKVAVLRTPERFALFAAPIMDIFSRVFKGFVDLLDWATRAVIALLGYPPTDPHAALATLEEIKQMVSGPEVSQVIEKPEREMLSAVIDFGELVVRQVSRPRTEIVAVEATASVQQAIDAMLKHGITKLPVYEEDLDHITGIVHLRDLVPALQDCSVQPQTVGELAREALFIPENVSVNDLLREFRSRRAHIAIVLDEFSGTSGLVTLDDLLEEIFGVMQDSFDVAPPSIQPQPDGSAIIDGMTFIEEVNQFFGLQLEEPDYDTIAGYILGRLGRIPQAGDTVEDADNKIRLEVKKMDRLRIALVHLSRL